MGDFDQNDEGVRALTAIAINTKSIAELLAKILKNMETKE